MSDDSFCSRQSVGCIFVAYVSANRARYGPDSTVYRRVNSLGAAPGRGAGNTNSIWAENFLGTMTARPEAHSTASVCRPEARISIRLISAGTRIGSPDRTKSSQCGPDVDFAGAEGI